MHRLTVSSGDVSTLQIFNSWQQKPFLHLRFNSFFSQDIAESSFESRITAVKAEQEFVSAMLGKSLGFISTKDHKISYI